MVVLILLIAASSLKAQDIHQLVDRVKEKMEQVHDYEAKGKLKTNVTFLKVPVAPVTVFFQRPNHLKIKSDRGIAFIPKNAVTINTGMLLEEDKYTVIDGGTETVNGRNLRIARLLSNDENSDVVLSTLYIDPVSLVIVRARVTTAEQGTYNLELSYGKYIQYGLPDKVIFSFNTKDYKLPKGITFDFDPTSKKQEVPKSKQKKGKAEIIFTSYQINKGIPASVF